MIPLRNKLQTLSLPAILLLFFFTACDDSSTGPDNEFQVETFTATDIPADTAGTGEYTFFSLRKNTIVEDSASTEWDIALAGTSILTNSGVSGPGSGGALILDVAFDDVTIAPSEGYNADTDTLLAIPTGGGNGWYIYTNMNQLPYHTILPIENKTIVLKTGDGQYYAKMRILSYYKGNPEIGEETPSGDITGFYTFEYTIQLNGSREFVEEE